MFSHFQTDSLSQVAVRLEKFNSGISRVMNGLRISVEPKGKVLSKHITKNFCSDCSKNIPKNIKD